MKNTNRSRTAGIVCMIAAVVWIAAINIEYPLDLQPPGSGMLFYLNQTMFLAAMVGYVAGIFGLFWAQAVGSGRFAKAALGLFLSGWGVLIIATILGLLTGNYESPLFPLGGLAATLGCVLSGIAVARANRWHGWQRWSVLIYALYYLAALFLPLAIANREPNQITESVWGLAWLLIGLALYTRSTTMELVTA